MEELTLKHGDKINIDGDEYEVIINPDNTISLKTYDEECKVWVRLNFAKEHDPQIDKELIKMLSDLYIKEVTGQKI